MEFKVGQIWKLKIGMGFYGWKPGMLFKVHRVDDEGDAWTTTPTYGSYSYDKVCVCKERIADDEIELIKDVDDE